MGEELTPGTGNLMQLCGLINRVFDHCPGTPEDQQNQQPGKEEAKSNTDWLTRIGLQNHQVRHIAGNGKWKIGNRE